MKTRILGMIIGLATMMSALPVGAGETAGAPSWRAGTAKAIITPRPAFWLAGYASRSKPADGKLHDIWMKALALEDAEGHKSVVVTADLLGYPNAFADTIVSEVQKQFGLERSQILLTCSHTHSGPVLDRALNTVYPMDAVQVAQCAAYTRWLEQIAIRTIGEALSKMSPVSVSVGAGACTFAVNRRNNPEKDVPQLLAEGKPLKGPVDHSVPVMAVRQADGRLLAVLFLYACHNTTLDLYQYSGDYAGFAQLALESKHPEATAMFAIGCGADQNPMPRRTVELCKQYGEQLAAAVDAVLAQPMQAVAPSLRTQSEVIDLPFDGELKQERLQADAAKDDYLGRYAKETLRLMAEAKAGGKELPKSYPYPVQVWRLGENQYWVSLGGEVVVDYSLKFKAAYGQNTWVFGYSNDVMSYIPSSRVWKEGGYESNAFNVYGVPAARWCPDIEDRISAAVEQLMARCKQN